MATQKIILLLTLLTASALIYLNMNNLESDQGLLQVKEEVNGYQTAQLTYYSSYATCCKGNPNYDPNASKEECEDYSACEYPGDFAAIGHKSFDYVKSHNIIAFYDDRDQSGSSFDGNYGRKTIKLRKNGKEFTAQIADTCGNQDCNNCCHKNSKGGFLIDLEYYTVLANLGSVDNVGGTIEFMIV